MTTLLKARYPLAKAPAIASPASLTLPREPRTVGNTRHWLINTLRAWGIPAPAVDTAELATSEAVTNAIKASGDGPTTITANHTPGLLRITVTDPDPITIPAHAGLPCDDDENGRGLFIIAMLTDRHGFDVTATGKALWFELSLDETGAAR